MGRTSLMAVCLKDRSVIDEIRQSLIPVARTNNLYVRNRVKVQVKGV